MSNYSEDMWNMVVGCIITSHLDHKRRIEAINFVRRAEERLNTYEAVSALEDKFEEFGD